MKKFIFVVKYIRRIRKSVSEWENADYERQNEIGEANAKILDEYVKLFGEISDVDFSKLFFTKKEIKRMLDNGTL